MTEVPRTPTGISGLDAMIKGGIPCKRTVLIIGGPGTGKTTLAIQYLVNGILSYGENGVFVSLDVPKEKIFEEAKCHAWDLEKFCSERRIAFVDGSPYARLGYETVGYRMRKTVLHEPFETVRDAARSVNAKRICIDTLSALTIHYPDVAQRRERIIELFQNLSTIGATSIITDEARETHERMIPLEEYLADGVIKLQSSQIERKTIRMIEIVKMKATGIDEQVRPYVIGEEGLSVLSDRDIFAYAAHLLMKK